MVALLVLMALIGTAFIVTARTDRTAARLHAHNAQADMAVQSAVNLVVAELSADLFAPSGSSQFKFARDYRPPTVEGGNVPPFENWDAIGDAMIGPRVPVLMNPTGAPTSLYPSTPTTPLFPFDPAGVNPPVWLDISGTPKLPDNQLPRWSSDPLLNVRRIIAYAPTARPYLGHPLWPHLQIYREGGVPWDADPSTPEIDAVPAADADGDGIADAELWKLPIGPMNGVTYYAAVRVVDNNSAVNVNTALARDFDFDGNLNAIQSPYTPSYFLGRVGLAEMLRTYMPGRTNVRTLGDEFFALNLYRNNAGGPFVAGVPGRGNRFPNPFDDRGAARTDFHFLSLADALESQLGRRIGNPGTSLGPLKFRPFTMSDSMALGYRFCLADGTASPSALEQVLNQSLFQYADATGKKLTVPTTPYRADETLRWVERFRYDLEDPAKPPTTFRDLRALLVARNPVANQAPARYSVSDLNGDGDRNDTPGERSGGKPTAIENNSNVPGGMMEADGSAIRPYEGIAPYVRPGAAGVRTRAVPPVPINTAAFPELWRGFWAVIVPWYYELSHPLTTPMLDLSPYAGNHFQPDGPTSPDPFKPIDEHHPQLMFRSSIRDVRDMAGGIPARLPVGAEGLLRAALAAVNAEDLRDEDDDVSSHLIELELHQQVGGRRREERVPVRVYGTERQPFLTEVYVNTDDRPRGPDGASNPKGYVAIELHNPYDQPIEIGGVAPNGWSVGLINRSVGVGNKPRLQILNLDGTQPGPGNIPWRFPAGTVIPGHGYLVLENFAPAGGDAYAARYRPPAAREGGLPAGAPPSDPPAPGDAPPGPATQPAASAANTVYVPNLHKVLQDLADPSSPGGEFVILRTRRADCVNTVGAIKGQADVVDEANNLSDMVPVDQFDFTGATLPAVPGGAPASIYTTLHYARANDPAAGTGAAWRFVYPGRYDGLKISGRHQGATQVQFGPGLGNGAADGDQHETFVPKVLLGAPDPTAHPYQGSFPIPLANFPPVSPRTAGGNAFPFGLFAREADLLRVPFIGAYTVYAPATAVPVDAPLPSPRPPAGPGTQIYEMNGISMDSAFAEDTDTTDDPGPGAGAEDAGEQVGRFCPVQIVKPVGSRDPRVDDFAAGAAYPKGVFMVNDKDGLSVLSPAETADKTEPPTYRSRYRWATDLFDQFSIHAPNNDFLPNVAPSQYHTASGAPISPPPQPVSNSGGIPGNAEGSPLDPNDTANDYAEDLEPVDGLVNINTAPWKVLAALPMVLNGDGSVNVPRNIDLAKAIVYFRDIHNGYQKDAADTNLYPNGPFASVFELNEVWDSRPAAVGFRDTGKYPGRGRDYRFGNAYGTFSVTGNSDFARHYEVLGRISNLITTRSDSFTCYVYVMGVQHDGAPDAEIKEQRRVAFIADRSGVRPLRPVVRTLFFNNE